MKVKACLPWTRVKLQLVVRQQRKKKENKHKKIPRKSYTGGSWSSSVESGWYPALLFVLLLLLPGYLEW